MSRLLLAIVLAGCSNPPARVTTGSGSGSGPVGACEAARPKIEQLYRAEAQVKQPKRVDDAVADNTTMVMNDCAKAPDKVAACIRSIGTIGELEAKCLRPLDEEGTEGNELR